MTMGDLRRAMAYPGWRSVLLAFLLLLFVFGAPMATMPLIYGEVVKEFGWKLTQATFGYSLGTWLSASASFFVIGALLEKWGLRTLMVLSILLSGGGMIAFLQIHSLWSYYLVFAPMGIGYGAAMIAAKVLVSRWYTRNLGMAVAVAMAGSSLAGVILPLVCATLIAHFGWRMAMASIGAFDIAIILPLYLWLARENPTEEQIVPEALKVPANPAVAERMRQADLGLTYGQVLRTPMFWIVVFGIVLIQGVDQGMFQHTALYLQREKHLARGLAAGAISGMFAISAFSKLFAGWVFDRYSIKGIQVWWLAIGAVVLLAFPVQGALTLTIFAVSKGVAHGGMVIEGPIISKHCFGPRLFNNVYPVMVGALSLGSGAGALIISAMVDHFGHYTEALVSLIIASLAAASLLFFVKPLYRDRLLAAQGPAADDPPLPAAAGLAPARG
jgi:OFA family oxalate/formate antiporter-like MFS transporter